MPAAPNVAVFAPALTLSVTLEQNNERHDEIHFHAGGQAIWIARMLRHLGELPVVCTPLGGESGNALAGLARGWEIELEAVPSQAPSSAYVHDRRSGERHEVARSLAPQLTRHELDELYGRFLERSLATGVCVVVGQLDGEAVPTDFYRRLGADLAATDIQVVGDLHGPELDALLASGRLRWLKVSDQDLRQDGLVHDGSAESAATAAERLAERGCEGVIVSRSKHPALAWAGGRLLSVEGPDMEVVDHRGAGDSMTAALTAAVIRDLPLRPTLQLAWAAGAANVTRHGLGSTSSTLPDALTDRVTVTPVDRP